MKRCIGRGKVERTEVVEREDEDLVGRIEDGRDDDDSQRRRRDLLFSCIADSTNQRRVLEHILRHSHYINLINFVWLDKPASDVHSTEYCSKLWFVTGQYQAKGKIAHGMES